MMITRLLLIDSDAEALARIKNALERAGSYEAKVFVTGQAALEYAAQYPPSVAVIALNITDITPPDLVQALRRLRPGLPVLLRAPAAVDERVVHVLRAQGLLVGAYTTRALLPLVESALQAATHQEQPASEPSQEPASQDTPARPYRPASGLGDDFSAFGEVLETIKPGTSPAKNDDSFNLLVESLRAPVEKPPLPQRRERLANWAIATDEISEEGDVDLPPGEDRLFQKLAAEEPPVPTLEDTGTVRDLIAITDFSEQDEDAAVVEIPEDMIESMAGLSLSEQEQDLLHALAAVSETPHSGGTSPVVSPHPELVPMPDDIRSRLENDNLLHPAGPLPPPATGAAAPPAYPVRAPSDTPDSAHPAARALQITQERLESSAQASILIREDGIIAWVGALAQSDIEQIVSMVNYTSVQPGDPPKIKFVSLPEAHLHYMVVATPTVEDMVLLTVFPDSMHLRIIRQQTRNILEALLNSLQEPPAAPEEVEEVPPAAEEAPAADLESPAPSDSAAPEDSPEPGEAAPVEAPPIDPATLMKYACAWILRDPQTELDRELLAALPAWIDDLIAERRWLCEQIDAQPDYLSLVISIPPAETPSEVVQWLMAETAQKLLAARPGLAPGPEAESGLWADAYYIIAPGRPLTSEEISRFIRYQRES